MKDGTVTAGNAPGLNDGASALVVASLAFAQAHGLTPLARVTAYATGGGEPKDLFFAPIVAVQNLMKKEGTTIGDYDLIEANEAFAVQALADGAALGWDWSRVNVNGGAVALGHPIGASGARVLTTLLYAMQDRGKATGLATLCLGGGNAGVAQLVAGSVALSVERISPVASGALGSLPSLRARALAALAGALAVALASQVAVPLPGTPVP